MLSDLANIWIGCGCLFGLGAVVHILLVGLTQGGLAGVASALGLMGLPDARLKAWERNLEADRAHDLGDVVTQR